MGKIFKIFKKKTREFLPFDIWDYTPKSIQRIYVGKPLMISRKIRSLKKKLVSGSASWEDLCKYAKISGYDNNHSFYQSALQSFDHSLDFDNITGIDFVGFGLGVGSLNCYRKVEIEIEGDVIHCFEKVYDRQSMDFRKMEWFYNSVAHQVKSEIKIPVLINIKGKRIGLAYFEWIEPIAAADDEIFSLFKQVTNTFGSVKLGDQPKELSFVSDYSKDLLFDCYYERARLWLCENLDSEQRKEFDKLHSLILNDPFMERRFVHGNLSKANLLSPNILIDFDNCGFYPFEYELGSFLTSVFTFENLDQFYKKLSFINKDNNDLNEQRLLYFTFIFNMRIKHRGEEFNLIRKRFLLELWEKLRAKL